jgi:hypothetical protein
MHSLGCPQKLQDRCDSVRLLSVIPARLFRRLAGSSAAFKRLGSSGPISISGPAAPPATRPGPLHAASLHVEDVDRSPDDAAGLVSACHAPCNTFVNNTLSGGEAPGHVTPFHRLVTSVGRGISEEISPAGGRRQARAARVIQSGPDSRECLESQADLDPQPRIPGPNTCLLQYLKY